MAGKTELATLFRGIARSKRPNLVLDVAAELVEHMDRHGRVSLTRQEIADRLGVHHTKISTALRQLEDMGAIFRQHDRRTSVCATIFVSANLATMLSEKERRIRQAHDPLVRPPEVATAA